MFILIKGYRPLPLFPSISITGDKCGLNCKFCRGKVLREMFQATSPHELYELVKFLSNKHNILGILISGGFDRSGYLPIKPFTTIIREIKRDFDLIVSVHCGFVDDDYVKILNDANIDIVDLSVYGPLTMKDILGLKVDWNIIEDSLKLLYYNSHSYIAPHILVGSYYGCILEEKTIIDLIGDFNPYIMIFLSLIPVEGTEFYNVNPVDVNIMYELFKYARNTIPNTELTLGCMRLRGKYSSSIENILYNEKLIDRIVLPNYIKADVLLPFCCSLPIELENKLLCKLDRKENFRI